MKKKSLFVISPLHYDHSVAAVIEGLNKLDEIKVFSNANHNYFKQPLINYTMLWEHTIISGYTNLLKCLFTQNFFHNTSLDNCKMTIINHSFLGNCIRFSKSTKRGCE